MRILLYAGKGGVGKTSVSGATGVLASQLGLNTLVMSLDPAHSLADAFDLDRTLMDKNHGAPIVINKGLSIQEVDVHEEISKHWGEVHKYLSVLLSSSGIEEVLAEELAILPGMEEVAALLYVNQYAKEESYDLIILDCAPTAESIRFVSLPKTLEWYMRKIFSVERKIIRYIRPVAKRVSDFPLPEEEYFDSIERLFHKLQGVDELLTDPEITSVRLVTNLEKMVLRETQRAFMFFSLHQMSIDGVIINRVFSDEAKGGFMESWQKSQKEYIELANSYFHPVPLLRAPYYNTEVLGLNSLGVLARELYKDRNPADIFYSSRTCEFSGEDGRHIARIHLPFTEKAELELSKVGEELIVRIGNFKRNIILPRAFIPLEPEKARLIDDYLVVDFGGNNE
ncbi:MAG: TRC40/GET3/ArsA family transport-energizing ATPase [Syntrophobacteraceae bacterium]|nr:TRC40/GET3/ArsA family transport-energizing ATPase [Syntrophobacteraceae bacterium]